MGIAVKRVPIAEHILPLAITRTTELGEITTDLTFWYIHLKSNQNSCPSRVTRSRYFFMSSTHKLRWRAPGGMVCDRGNILRGVYAADKRAQRNAKSVNAGECHREDTSRTITYFRLAAAARRRLSHTHDRADSDRHTALLTHCLLTYTLTTEVFFPNSYLLVTIKRKV